MQKAAEYFIQGLPHVQDKAWLEDAWSSEFMAFQDPPEELQDLSDEVVKALDLTAKGIRAELENSNISEIRTNDFWNDLENHNLDSKSILPVLCYFIYNALKNYDDTEVRKLGIKAASCYLMILSIEGHKTTNMYHSIMLSHCLSLLKLATTISISKKVKSKKGTKQTDESDEEEDERAQLGEMEKSIFLKSLGSLLGDLLLVIKNVSLCYHPDDIDPIIETLIKLTFLEHNTRLDSFEIPPHYKATHAPGLAALAYEGLYLMCDKKHGDVSDTTITVTRHILGVLLASQQSTGLDFAPREFAITRDNSLQFVLYLVEKIGEPSWEGTTILLQHLLTRDSERAEHRLRAAELASKLLHFLPAVLRCQLCKWVWFMSLATKPAYRLVGQELALQLLKEEELEHCTEEEIEAYKANQRGEEDEKMSPVPEDERMTPVPENAENQDESSKNDTGNGESTEQENESPTDGDKDKTTDSEKDGTFLALRHSHLLLLIIYRCDDQAPTVRARALTILAELASDTQSSQRGVQLLQELLAKTEQLPELSDKQIIRAYRHREAPLSCGHYVKHVAKNMTEEERVMVRKAALTLLINIALGNNHWIDSDLIEVLQRHSLDPAMSVRRQIIQGVTQLLHVHGNANPVLRRAWMVSVLPLLQDPETRVGEYALELSRGVLLESICPHGMVGSSELPWQLYRLVPESDTQNLISSALRAWAKNGLPSNFVRCLVSHLGTENNAEAWRVLSYLAETTPLQKPSFAVEHLNNYFVNSPKEEYAVVHCIMRVLLLSTAKLSKEELKTIRDLLMPRLKALNMPIDLIAVSFDLVAATYLQEKDSDPPPLAQVQTWCKEHIKAAQNCLIDLVKETPTVKERQLLIHVCTLGDAVRVGNLTINSKIVRILHSIVLAKHTESNRIVNLKVWPHTLHFEPSPLLCAVTVVTLGKLALQQETTAHELLPAFGLLLECDINLAVKCNVLYALADLCGRYAVLVDPLVPRMAACLRSPDLFIRRLALVLMVQLLQEDYLKLKHGLIFFLLRMLCDPELELQDMAKSYLSDNLLKKQPKVFFTEMQSAIYVFNGHPSGESECGAGSARLQPEVAKLLQMPGSQKKPERLKIYSFMLENMNDDHRFEITHHLCKDILGGFVDERLVLTGPGFGLLSDTLAVLRCDDIRLRSMHAKPSDENDVPDPEEACNNAMVTAKKAVVTHIVRKNVMENIVPIIRSLKLKLQSQKSPLADDLMFYLRDLMRNFKSEIEVILAADKQLASEVAFDIRQIERQERQNQEEEEENV